MVSLLLGEGAKFLKGDEAKLKRYMISRINKYIYIYVYIVRNISEKLLALLHTEGLGVPH